MNFINRKKLNKEVNPSRMTEPNNDIDSSQEEKDKSYGRTGLTDQNPIRVSL